MSHKIQVGFASSRRAITQKNARHLFAIALIVALPLAAHAQAGGSPFDTGFTALQTLFTGTVAKVASLIAIVIGGTASHMVNPAPKRLLLA